MKVNVYTIGLIAVIAIYHPCLSLDVDNLTGKVFPLGALQVTFGNIRSYGTGSVLYDAVEMNPYTKAYTPYSLKVCKVKGPHFSHEQKVMNYLAIKTHSAMTAYALPEIHVSELEGHRFVAMQQIGKTLKEKLGAKAPLSSRDQKSVLRSLYVVFKALEFLHGNGVVHGQVVAQNIMVSPSVQLMDFVQSQRYPRASSHRHVYYNFEAKDPAKANSHFVSKKRRTRAHDLKQFAKVLQKAYPKGINDCSNDGYVFPEDFTEKAEALHGDDLPSYSSLRAPIESCMEVLGMKIPSYPLK